MPTHAPPPAPGCETYTWLSEIRMGKYRKRAGYDYRYTTDDGATFQTFGQLADCRARRDRWLQERKGVQS